MTGSGHPDDCRCVICISEANANVTEGSTVKRGTSRKAGRRTSWDDLTPEQQYRRNMLAIAVLMGLFVVALAAVYGLALLTLWVLS